MRLNKSPRNPLFSRTGKALRRIVYWLSQISSSNELGNPSLNIQKNGHSNLLRDARSGLNVALLAFPQGMAYALVAGLPIHYGITCSIVAAIVAPIFSYSRYPILGPTNATAFMIFSYFLIYSDSSQVVSLMPLLVLMVALILLTGAFFKVADLVQYVSRAVIIGYIAGAALLIIANQLNHVFGIDTEKEARSFFTILFGLFDRLDESNNASILLGLGTMISYFVLRRTMKALPTFAITLLLATIVNYFLGENLSIETFKGKQEGGTFLPEWSVFHSPSDLIDKVWELSGIAMGLAFLITLEISVVTKSIASRTGDSPKLNKDIFGSGIANIGCALLSGMPASGSLTRSALNLSSGASGKLSSVFSGLICGIGIWILSMSYFIGYIPKCALSALVIAVALSLFDWKQIIVCLWATRSDAFTFLVTFGSALIMPLHVAIFIGAATAVALFLRKAARPELVEYDMGSSGQLNELKSGEARTSPAISIVHVEGELFFGAAELFRNQIQSTASDPNLKVIILRMKNARHLDATSVIALEELVAFLRGEGRELLISGVMKEVYKVLKSSGAVQFIGRENIFPGSISNPNLATKNALKRAQEIIGSSDIDVRIYHDPSRPTE
ncbi:MAG: sulfate permease [Verrucomicrobiales bacterium]|nr:sulfate permease [Verrucomicrobiales bacterium]